MTWSGIDKLTTAAKGFFSLVVGGAAGAVTAYFTSTPPDGKIDWHAMKMQAVVGALVAVSAHFAPSAVTKKEPPPQEPPRA